MKFLLNSSDLLKQVQLVSGVLASNNSLPILDNFLFEIKDSKLTISASDLETTMTTSMAIEAQEDGVIAIPAKILLDTLKTFPSQPLTFTIDPKTFAIEISNDNGRYNLSGVNGDEFPKAPPLESGHETAIHSEILARAINRTLFAAGDDELRPVMSGIFFELYGDSLRFVATDAHKLVRYTRTDASSEQDVSFIVPKKPLTLLKNIVGGADSMVKLEYSESNVYFTLDNVSLMCRLIEGKYPNYEAVIPKDNPKQLGVSRTDLLNSIKRVSIFSNKTTHQVRLKITGSELTVSAEDLDFANAASERLACTFNGEDMEIGFNSRFLAVMLGNISSDNVILQLSEPSRAGIIVPETPDEDGEDVLMLVMPVMLNA